MDRPGATPGLDATRAASERFGVLSPELYPLFVRDRGWPHEEWERWAHEVLHARLCAGPVPAR